MSKEVYKDKDLIIKKNNRVIVPLGPAPEGGDIHETFDVDNEGNVSGGHTTIRIPGNKETHQGWDKE